MLNVKDIYPSRWLSASDINRPVVVQITACTLEEVRDPRGAGTSHKLCLAFARATKRMLLNKTQATALAEMYGPDAELWPGHAVQLLPDRSPNGRPTIAVRHPPESPSAQPEAPAPADPTPAAAWDTLVTATQERKQQP